ncbi:secretion protein HlyD family protein [Ancylobacter novellus DSM 506]|uniref:Secretion protein HlyD family protein n=1 Tax=Ancylobacter novellus (strain ATCC 8093 / DSM 506 / JCM 20403 / CCM 1077 / IAM 12100 / NBRC 12443 / NCIMB 10456) TaxID=639283 RepID=D7A580_ANCN5|nr:HlyD family secretion protein [Ancylobacter novellus]ADH89968.1 secretion protein HlyD family protein [Ancylobacter novellus DSM 506]
MSTVVSITTPPAELATAKPAVSSPAISAAGARRWLIPCLSISVVAVFIAVATGQWDRWIGNATVQVTNDATIRAELSGLSARVSGNVVAIPVQDYQPVRAGELLLQIDPSDYQVAVDQAEAGVAGATATLRNLDNQIALQQATIAQAEAQLASAQAKALQATQEQQRQQELLQSTFGTRQRLEQADAELASNRAAVQAAEAGVRAQQAQLDVLTGTRPQREADLRVTEAALAGAKLRLGYTHIVAPFDGVVGQRQVQLGDYVTTGGNLISVVPLPQVYVIANYKETQLTHVEAGQPVEVTVDTFPDEVLKGRVERISPASGSQFALLPPDNATGNFTKVVQRIPVRVALDPGQPLLDHLRPGMSVVTRIDTSAEDRP